MGKLLEAFFAGLIKNGSIEIETAHGPKFTGGDGSGAKLCDRAWLERSRGADAAIAWSPSPVRRRPQIARFDGSNEDRNARGRANRARRSDVAAAPDLQGPSPLSRADAEP
jgi:hypothetical protein